ncbi:DUF3576 domain-containing protein [Roseovarius salinarum]|jgi:hypothetical protein|uniref:DUF3576 domain-containing protein n=1 Tax=Roseovarius salinarum TaxID=1981892 RepID=UPI000C34DFE6|nr:DUF3576 domain-containing protein [Roseovarius salinarum]
MHLSAKKAISTIALLGVLAACGGQRDNLEPSDGGQNDPSQAGRPEGSLLDALGFGDKNPGVKVNRFLWQASLDVLDFLPVEAADPFTGVISTGYGTPPGGGRAYRATVLIKDPALDARSLNVALQTRRGPVAESTRREIEDAILGRARQLRIEAGRF